MLSLSLSLFLTLKNYDPLKKNCSLFPLVLNKYKRNWASVATGVSKRLSRRMHSNNEKTGYYILFKMYYIYAESVLSIGDCV